jgi:AcrR family transcriptional regulator
VNKGPNVGRYAASDPAPRAGVYGNPGLGVRKRRNTQATTRKAALAPADDLTVERPPVGDGADEPDGRSRPAVRRRGRPADSDGLTGQRILSAARECFAESGYVAASTHMVAARVGLTTGALYHHFGSKRELYLAVFEEVEQFIYDRFRAATESHVTFAAKVDALLEETVRLSKADPTVAGFALSVTGDLPRHPDLMEGRESAWRRRDSFFAELVDVGIAGGEVAAADRHLMFDTLTTMVTGLIVVGAGVPATQTRAVKGLKRLLAGTLTMSESGKNRGRRRA